MPKLIKNIDQGDKDKLIVPAVSGQNLSTNVIKFGTTPSIAYTYDIGEMSPAIVADDEGGAIVATRSGNGLFRVNGSGQVWSSRVGRVTYSIYGGLAHYEAEFYLACGRDDQIFYENYVWNYALDGSNTLIAGSSLGSRYWTGIVASQSYLMLIGYQEPEWKLVDRANPTTVIQSGTDEIKNATFDSSEFVYAHDNGFSSSTVEKIDPSDGSIVWSRADFFGESRGPIAYANGAVYVGSSDGSGNALIHRIDPADGTDIWSTQVAPSATIQDICADKFGHVYWITSSGDSGRIDPDGNMVWRTSDAGISLHSGADSPEVIDVSSNGKVFIGSTDNDFRVFCLEQS